MSNRTLHKKNNILLAIGRSCSKIFIAEKLNNWLGILIGIFIALFFGYIMVHKMVLGMGIIAGLIGTGIVLACLFNTEFGFYLNVIYSFFAFYVSRFLFYYSIDLPVGVISDILTISTFLSMLIRRNGLRQSVNEFSRTSVVRCLFIIYGYFAIQLFNPNTNSFTGWYNAFRKLVEILLFFLTTFYVIRDYRAVKKFITTMFILCTIAGVYGCIQEWHGLFEFETYWILSDPHGAGLAFIGGEFRKFSIMSDPAAFGIEMSACAVFFIVLLTNKNKRRETILLLGGIMSMVLAMSYSGTRTANAMLVAGVLFFILFTANEKRTWIFAAAGAFIFIALLVGPFNSPTIARFRTTFSAQDDASYKVREFNRKRIQYYIYSHPLGGGLATTGGTGVTNNPGHVLAGFQPDNGYLKKALEIGPIGLALYCILYFLILQAGINGYFAVRNKEMKIIYAACTCCIFCFYVGEYAQKAIGQITDVVIYYPLVVILLRLRNFNINPNFNQLETD